MNVPAPQPVPGVAPASGCLLCGGPIPPRAPAGYCCEGCARVSEILEASGFQGDRRTSAAYLEAARAGLVPGDVRPPAAEGRGPASADARQVCLGLDGLWCPSCAWLVEAVLQRTPGVQSARVTFFADLAEVSFDPAAIGEKEVAARVEELGYRVRREGDQPDRGPLVRFGVAAFLQMNVMWLSYALYAHGEGEALAGVAGFLPWLLAALSAPVVFGAGAPMLLRAWRALRAGALVMDSLIAFAAVTAWIYSLAAALRGSPDVYFDGACGLVTFRLLGRLLEQAAFRSAARAGEAVRRLLPRKARRLGEGGPTWVPAEALAPGDRIRVAPGERVPVDGRVVEGSGRVSTAVVDGEPRPRAVRPGSAVPGGSVCGEVALDLEVTAPAAASLLARVADHVARASGRRGPAPELADALARAFIPGVLVLSLVTLLAWLTRGLAPGDAFVRALSVLVVSCPCALGIAAPLSRVIAAGRLARRGVIVRGDGALDRVADARLVAFDKTGTLTQGRPGLDEVATHGTTPGEALAVLAALEERSGHPIASAVREALPAGASVPAVGDPAAVPGCGVQGVVDGAPAFAGRPDWIARVVGSPPRELEAVIAREEEQGRTGIMLAFGAGRWGVFAFGDALREEAARTIAELHGLGVETAIVTGDGRRPADVVARRTGVRKVVAGCLPDDKARFLEGAEAESGRRALFVGDGINDAPGLAAAVGVAVASGTDFARETADVLFLEPGLSPLPELVRSARRMRRVIRQNLAWAGLYNAVLIPLAMSGRLTPVWAAAAMVTSGLLVVANALRLQGGVQAAGSPSPANAPVPAAAAGGA